MGDAGRGGVDQLADAVRAAGIEHVLRADHIGLVVAVVTAPCAGFRRVVEHGIEATGKCSEHRIAIGQIARDLAHAECIQRRIVPAIEAGDVMSARNQPSTERLAEETATAGHEDLHSLSFKGCFAAHAASFSRPILALWRMSTGKGFG